MELNAVGLGGERGESDMDDGRNYMFQTSNERRISKNLETISHLKMLFWKRQSTLWRNVKRLSHYADQYIVSGVVGQDGPSPNVAQDPPKYSELESSEGFKLQNSGVSKSRTLTKKQTFHTLTWQFYAHVVFLLYTFIRYAFELTHQTNFSQSPAESAVPVNRNSVAGKDCEAFPDET